MRVGSGAGGTQVREPEDPPGCLLTTSLQKPFCSCALSHSPHQSPLHCLKHLLCAGAEPTAQCGASEALEVCPHPLYFLGGYRLPGTVPSAPQMAAR